MTARPRSDEQGAEDSEFELELARAVIRERKRRHWTQQELAERVKLSPKTIRLVEEGHGGRLRLAGGLRLLRLLGLRLRFVPVVRPSRKESLRRKRLIERGTE